MKTPFLVSLGWSLKTDFMVISLIEIVPYMHLAATYFNDVALHLYDNMIFNNYTVCVQDTSFHATTSHFTT